MDLNDYRKEIDSIDDQLIALFAQRMETAEKIAEYKKANGLRVLDACREKEKMREILDKTPDDLREYVSSLYSLIFELSRSRQSCLLGTKGDLPAKIAEAIEKTPQLFPEDAAVACQGVEGAYSEQACERLFKRPSTFFFSSFEAVFSAIEKGLCRYGNLSNMNSVSTGPEQASGWCARCASRLTIIFSPISVRSSKTSVRSTHMNRPSASAHTFYRGFPM